MPSFDANLSHTGLDRLANIEQYLSVVSSSTIFAPPPSGDSTGQTDFANLQALLNTAGVQKQSIYLDQGIYQLNQAITINSDTKLIGPGEYNCTIKRVANIGTPVTIVGNDVTLEGFTVDGGLSSFPTNADHGIGSQNVSHLRIRRVRVINYNNSAILLNATVSRTYFDVAIEDCYCDGGGVANNGFLIVNHDRASIRGCRAENIPGNPGYGCQIKNDSRWCSIVDCDAYSCSGGMVFGFDGATSNGVIASRIVGCNAISCDGGVLMGAASNNVVAGVNIWQTTNVNDAVRLSGRGDGTNGSVGNCLSGITVHGTGASRSCVRFEDVTTDNMVTLDMVDASGSTLCTTAGTSDRNTVEVKKYVNAPVHELAVSGTPGSNNRVRRVEDKRVLLDSALGAVVNNFDRALPTAALAMTSQQPYYIPVYLQAGEVVSNITFHVSTLSVAPTNFYVGLYTTGLVQKAVSTDQAANVTTTGQKTLALSAPYTVLDSGVYYVALLNNGGTLSPLGLASSTCARLGSNPFAYAQDTSTTSTSLPAPGTIAAGTKALWVEVS